MNNTKMNIIFIFEVSRSKPKLEPNEILNDVLVETLHTRTCELLKICLKIRVTVEVLPLMTS